MLEEKISEHLGKPYIYLKDKKKFLCQNGVLFTLDEYKNGIDINKEYERRLREDTLYDYIYAKNTGILRKKRTTKTLQESVTADSQKSQEVHEESSSSDSNKNLPERNERSNENELIQSENDVATRIHTEEGREERSDPERRFTAELAESRPGTQRIQVQNDNGRRAVTIICLLLAFTSIISGYISTLHTATYLYDYVDMISAWLMSSSVTAYNATAFEVSVIFKSKKRYGLTFVFITLWGMVTLFSMATTVSVFYDRFNFTETQIALENKQSDSNKLALELLRTKEKDIREAIEFKKKDIEYRQEKDYATTAVRTELNDLQTKLQENLTEQEKLLKETPEITEKVTKRKESLFSFLGRLMHLEGGILEFIMSTLSAIFVNLIAPLSLTAVTELLKNNKQTLTK